MRLIRLPELRSRVGYSPMHIWRLEKAGRFPRRLKLGPNSVGWLASEIDDWIVARVAERDAKISKRDPTTPVDKQEAADVEAAPTEHV